MMRLPLCYFSPPLKRKPADLYLVVNDGAFFYGNWKGCNDIKFQLGRRDDVKIFGFAEEIEYFFNGCVNYGFAFKCSHILEKFN